MPIAKIGDWTVVDSGSIVLARGRNSFDLSVFNVIYRFDFEYDKEKALENAVEIASSSEGVIDIRFVNWYNPLGTVVEFGAGKIDKEDLLLSVYSSIIGERENHARMVIYTLYRGVA